MMQSNFKVKALAALAVGALMGAQEAAAWCPANLTNRTISCNNCTVTLTCNLNGGGPIQITGYDVTFDGDNYSISNTNSYGISVASDFAVIQNVNIINPTLTGVRVVSGTGDYVRLENVYVESGSVGMDHYNEGEFQVMNSYFYSNQYGVAATSDNAVAKGDVIESYVAYNSNSGMYMSQKSGSYIGQNWFYNNGGHGAEIWASPSTVVTGNNFWNNAAASRDGLRLYYSNGSQIISNAGGGNGAHDCNVFSYPVYASGNTWTTSTGTCN